MIISRTPLRISFAGGGTDLPSFYRDGGGGAVIGMTIDKYVYITVNRKFDNRLRVSYSETENVAQAADLKHDRLRAILGLTRIVSGLEITSISDIPSSGTGMGSSSSYCVGALNALHAYQGRAMGAESLASEACKVEIEMCGHPIGKQDQYYAAYGGLQFFQFNSDDSVFADPIICSAETKEKLQKHLLLMYTGITRSANDILAKQSEISYTSSAPKMNVLADMRDSAYKMRDLLQKGAVDDFGAMLDRAWWAKKKLATGITNTCIEGWYRTAQKHGAIGGKVCGAGGGGFMLFFAPPEKHAGIIASVPGMVHTPFKMEPQGSKIIFVEGNYAR